MRRSSLVVLGMALLALAGASAAGTQKTTVAITQFGFVPESVAVASGETVVWENFETIPHQVVAEDASFSSPVLGPGERFSFTFRTPGTHAYRDGSSGKYRGLVRVGGTSTGAVTLAAASRTVVYGRRVRLSGTVSSGRAGEQVTVVAKLFGLPARVFLAPITTGADGAWAYEAKPRIRTDFQALWGERASASVVVRVRPLVTLSVRRGVFWTSVTGARSFEGRLVLLQRRSAAGEWVTVRRITLVGSSTTVHAQLPPGRSLLRILLPRSQAGAGYVAGVSRVLFIRR